LEKNSCRRSVGAFTVIVLLALCAYVNPAMLIAFANLRLCN